MMQIPICLVLIVVYACNATINITGEDKLSFENTEKLSITCTNNVDAIVEFRKSDSLLTTCVLSSSCSFIDQRFTVVFESSEKQYLLESVSNFTTDLCGSYKCVDVTNGRSDTVNVSFKDFDITSSHAEENEDELSISTACVFPATPDDIEITWYTLDNKTLQRISDEDVDEFKRFNRSTLCSNVTCGMHHARSYTFGLNFTGMRRYFFLSYVEIKIVHAMFKDKPLVWRSSKKYHVLAQSAPYQPDRDSYKIYLSVGMSLLITVFLASAIFKIIKTRIKKKRRYVYNTHLFESFETEEKTSIADAMSLKRIRVKGMDNKHVTVKGVVHVIVEGEIHVSELTTNEEAGHGANQYKLEGIGRIKTFGIGCAFVIDSQPPEELTLTVDMDSHKSMNEAWKSDKVPLFAPEKNVVIEKDVKLLVMSSANYKNSLMKYDKWKKILNDRVSPKYSKDPEENNREQTRVDDADDKQHFIIIEAPVPRPSTSETKHDSKQNKTNEKAPVGIESISETQHDSQQNNSTERAPAKIQTKSEEQHDSKHINTTEKGHPDSTGKKLHKGLQIASGLSVDQGNPEVNRKLGRNDTTESETKI